MSSGATAGAAGSANAGASGAASPAAPLPQGARRGPKTPLSLAELSVLLAPFDLRPRRVEPLEAGTINSNFRVDTDGGPLFVRVNEGKREADVRFEAALLWHLGARHYPTPQPLRRPDGAPCVAHGDQWVTAFPWVPGEPPPEASLAPAHCAAVGEALGRLHVAAADFPERREGIYSFERIAERVDRARGPLRSDPRLAEVVPSLDEEVAFLRSARVAELPSGIIHADLFPDNVLFRGERLCAVLDFEQACFGRYAYDLAVTLLAFCWAGAALDPARARALVSGYQRRRPLSLVERGGLAVEARVAALRFTVTRITDVFLPGLVREGKDFRAYHARLRWLREHALPSLWD